MKVALLGAESTGKTWLAQAMAERLRVQGHRVAVVPEVLRHWCEAHGRSPQPQEHLAIGQAQEAQVDLAAAQSDIVIADTTALMVAIYGALLFDDHPLYRLALVRLRTYGLVLLTGLDLPWVADGLHRRDASDRAAVDAMVRQGLSRAGVDWRVVYGQGVERCDHALESVAEVAPWAWAPRPAIAARWQGACEGCGDPGCEQGLFRRLLKVGTGDSGPNGRTGAPS
ncbi:ATP-binding protein [Ramlibacter sp. AW1]|uniref:ATP-binding protein n=1 Tax=Ramlibacter aurantiacus TaxID=2801330 RepID=A0A936ZLL9_9BURK|nr:ATP-binding protein [Ramlibacter aurantiacus]